MQLKATLVTALIALWYSADFEYRRSRAQSAVNDHVIAKAIQNGTSSFLVQHSTLRGK